MYPTRLQVRTRFQALLDDPSGQVFTDAVFTEAFGEAYDALYTAFLTNQCPRITMITNVTVPPLTPSLTPAQMDIADFADFVWLAERPYGSTDKYRDLDATDRLSQRLPTDRLLEFCYRNDTFYFNGATGVIDLQMEYESSGEAPTSDATVIQVDSSLTFLSNYAVGVAGQRKGYDEVGQRCMSLAVGPRYNEGAIGGELYRLIQPRVRSLQHVQVAARPYSATRRVLGGRRTIPYVAAQQGTTGGGSQNVPIQFSSASGTITGTINGTNTVFFLSIGGVTHMNLFRNGLEQASGVNYNSVNNQITFLAGSVPQAGDILTAEVYTS